MLVSGKMLRYNEERNLIGFKYNNRSIRIFPVFDHYSSLQQRKESYPDDISNDSDHVEEKEDEEWISNHPKYKNGKKVDIQDLANTPKKVRSKSENDNPSGSLDIPEYSKDSQSEDSSLIEFNFTPDHFETLCEKKINPILISDILPEGYFITDFRIHQNVLIVAGTNFEIVIICLITKTILKRMTIEGIANCLAISMDGKYLAVGIVQDLNIYEIRGDISTDLTTIWLMKKFYCLHKSKSFENQSAD